MKKIFLLLIACLALLTSCEIDNYDEPTSSISGGIYDMTTEKLIPAQSPNGARIQIHQDGLTQPSNFWCKPDGTFENIRVFPGKYTVKLQGPFVASTITSQELNIPASNVKIMVEPFLRITATAQLIDNTIVVNYIVEQSAMSTGIVNTVDILYGNTIGLSSTTSKQRIQVKTSDAPLGTQHQCTITDIDTSGAIFVRVAARTSETSYYNYSELLQLK